VERASRSRSGAVQEPPAWPDGPGSNQYFRRIEGARRGPQDEVPRSEPAELILTSGAPNVKNRMQRAWQLALAIAPLAAIALVEAAMKRW
jgi:hypothetical protein